MRLQGVIEESQSPWVSPAVMVRKTDGLILGYWQIKIRQEDKEKTAFSIGNGLWQFTVMLFGLCNAPATFKRLMKRVLRELLFNICLVYLDDVIIFGKSFEDISRLKQVFSRLRSVNLKLNPKKCSSFKQEIKYLGHVQVRSFLGFCSYYRKFVKRVSLIAKPLFALTENLTKFVWTKQCEITFAELKKRLISSLILSFPKDKRQFILNTDASNHGINAILSQIQDGVEREIVSEGSSAKIYWSQWDFLELRDSILFRKWESPNLKSCVFQIIVPKKRVKEILKEVYDSPSGGHFGDVEDWCRSCRVCIAKRGPSDKGRSEMQIYNAGVPFERVQLDVVDPFPMSSSGNKYLLVITDCFIKWVEAFPLKNVRAKTVEQTFVNQLISKFGVPSEVHTGQGRNFDSRLFWELSHFLGIKKTRTTLFILNNQRNWDSWIGMCLLAYRTARHETTGVSSAESCFSRNLKLPLDLIRGFSRK
ncbi:hypothetical protein ACFW04_013729 [Cataglyphis niger]